MVEPPDGVHYSSSTDLTNDQLSSGSRSSAGVKLFRRYQVQRELGRGGMGMVVLAHDTALDIPVAVKLVPDLVMKDEEAIEDLRKEVLRGMALTHPGIVRTHNFEYDDSGAGIIMEYVDGDTLSAVKFRRPTGCCEPDEVMSWLEQLCPVLDYAHHEARIVHRDLKPRNVMLTGAGRVKVADFGIAATLNDSISRHSMEGKISGTISYMSPQQAQGHRPTHLDDIHALGATIYELLTGKPPFFRGNPASIHAQIITAVAPPMMVRRAELEVPASAQPIPQVWERVVAACLSKDPEARPQSASQLLAGLHGESITLGSAAKAKRWVWIGAGSTGVAVLGAIGFLGRHSPSPVPSATPIVETIAPLPRPAAETPTPAPTATPAPIATTDPTPVRKPKPTPAPTPLPAEPAPTPAPTPAAVSVAPTMQAPEQAAVAPTARPPSPTPAPFNGAYIVLPQSTPAITLPTPPPGVPVYRPDLTEAQFYSKYPNNPRAYGPGMWEQQIEEIRAAQEQGRQANAMATSFPSPSRTTPLYPGGGAPVPPPAQATPAPASMTSGERLASYARELDRWLTPLELEPAMRPQSDIHQLHSVVKAEAASAAKGDTRATAALALSDALVGAIDAREAVLARAQRTQDAPGTRLGGGNNSGFFMNVIRSDWEKARAGWRARVIQALARVQSVANPATSTPSPTPGQGR